MILLIGDPHIIKNNEIEWVGIYTVTLDEDGAQISNSVSEMEMKYLAYPITPSLIEFKITNWGVNMPFNK